MTTKGLIKLYTLIFASMFVSGNTFATNMSLNFGMFNEPKGERAGVEGSVWVEMPNHLAFRFSGIIFDGQNTYQDSDYFAGASAAAFLHMNNEEVNPYMGLGLEASSTLYCIAFHDDDDDDWLHVDQIEEECGNSKQAVLAVYPEVGVRFKIGSVTVSPFIRRYFDTNDNHPVTNAYGVNFAINFSLP